jgi:hypothetical protein
LKTSSVKFKWKNIINYFFAESDDFRQEVDLQLENRSSARAAALALNGEDTASDAQISGLHVPRPVIKDFLGVQLGSEAVTVGLQLLTLNVVFPSLA